jgi:DTW domain-containing protein
MGRSVVLAGTRRCEKCQQPPRWCVCAAYAPVATSLKVNVLMHHRESWKPTSTGRLIQRLIPSARVSIYRHDIPLQKTQVVTSDPPLWILHPSGDPVPAGVKADEIQILLLDGAWREATRMMHEVRSWGCLINLPMTGASRYWLRGQQEDGTYSTMEALLFALDSLGAYEDAQRLREQFELQVYAGLRSRGDKAAAESYLQSSSVLSKYSDLIAALNERRRAE